MKLYHGTNQPIKVINLNKGALHKDFGRGFYLTPNIETAKRMAKKRSMLDGGNPTLITYNFIEDALSDPTIKTKILSLIKTGLNS